MLMSDILKEADEVTASPKLVHVLRTIIGQADQKGEQLFLHFSQPKGEDLPYNLKNKNFSKYDTFKAAYDTDARVKSMIANFSEKGIEPKTKKTPSDTPQGDSQDGGKTVSQMAKSATNLGNNL